LTQLRCSAAIFHDDIDKGGQSLVCMSLRDGERGHGCLESSILNLESISLELKSVQP